MQFTPAFLDELRSRILPSEVIRKSVTLKQKSKGEFLGLCPFHKEKTPSFTVSDEKGFYHCFGCGKHGDIINFLIENNGLDFPESVKQLADLAGLPLPVMDRQAAEQLEKHKSLHDVMESACAWFESHAHQITSYLSERGISHDTAKHFRLGFAPDKRDGLKTHLLSKGFTEAQLLETGLIIQPEEAHKNSYDRFRGRVMFPICNIRGKVIAFGGRIIGEGQPKYLNSPETTLFKKGQELYNAQLARKAAFDAKQLVVVEGYMDVIALYQAGIPYAVAPLGTAMTNHHLAALWKMHSEPTLCLDGDQAGVNAMTRVAEQSLSLLTPGYSLRFALLPQGQDPDDIVHTHGKKGMKEILTQAIPLSEALWNSTYSTMRPSTPEQHAAFEKTLFAQIGKIQDRTVQNYYQQDIRNRLRTLHTNKRTVATTQPFSSVLKTAAYLQPSHQERFETILITMLIHHPELLKEHEIEDELTHIDISSEALKACLNALLDLHQQEDTLSKDMLCEALEKAGLEDTLHYICESPFLENFRSTTIPYDTIRLGWNFIFLQYQLSLVDSEYEQVVKQMSNDNMDKVWELKKDKDTLEKKVQNAKNHYETALES